MREIKFRVWNIDDKKWVKPEIEFIPYQSSDNKDMYLEGKWQEENGPITNIVFLQYTGLKDKNGKEIYEGDLVKYPIGNLMHVAFVNLYIDGTSLKKNSGYYWAYENPENLEVIGNQYENPELFKEVS